MDTTVVIVGSAVLLVLGCFWLPSYLISRSIKAYRRKAILAGFGATYDKLLDVATIDATANRTIFDSVTVMKVYREAETLAALNRQ